MKPIENEQTHIVENNFKKTKKKKFILILAIGGVAGPIQLYHITHSTENTHCFDCIVLNNNTKKEWKKNTRERRNWTEAHNRREKNWKNCLFIISSQSHICVWVRLLPQTCIILCDYRMCVLWCHSFAFVRVFRSLLQFTHTRNASAHSFNSRQIIFVFVYFYFSTFRRRFIYSEPIKSCCRYFALSARQFVIPIKLNEICTLHEKSEWTCYQAIITNIFFYF